MIESHYHHQLKCDGCGALGMTGTSDLICYDEKIEIDPATSRDALRKMASELMWARFRSRAWGGQSIFDLCPMCATLLGGIAYRETPLPVAITTP